MSDEKQRGPNGFSCGCLAAILGLVITYELTMYCFQSGIWGRYSNGGRAGQDIIALTSAFNAIVYGAPVGGLLGAIMGVFLARRRKRG